MYPREHALSSGISVLTYTVLEGLQPGLIPIWILAGTAAGVLIDVDHAILSMTVKGRLEEGLKWFKHPVKAISQPSRFLDDMDYESLVYHRLISHALIVTLLWSLSALSPLVEAAALGTSTHLAGDLLYDLGTGNYG